MNTNMTGFRGLSEKIFPSFALNKIALALEGSSLGRSGEGKTASHVLMDSLLLHTIEQLTLIETYPMNTNVTGLRWHKSLHPFALDESLDK